MRLSSGQWFNSAAKIACWLALLFFLSPVLIPRGLLAPGFNVFLAWTALCVAAVCAGRHVIWAALCILPLAGVSVDWLQGPRQDEFGFYPWSEITLFVGIALVIAATGTLSIVRAAMRDRT